ncbi:MAG: hypothetical protein V1770_02870 [bacterium]
MNQKIKLNLIILIILIAIAGGLFLFTRNKKNDAENKEENIPAENDSLKTKLLIEPKKDVENPEFSEEELADKLKKAIEEKDYEEFGNTLKIIYNYNWQDKKDLVALESKMYVIGTDEYYKKGNLEEGLKMANIISGKVFESWRFNYLKILCLEKMGLNEFEKGNYNEADKYAMEILSIEFRPEGVDLHARASIEKAKSAYKDGKIDEALSFLAKVEDYDLTKERREEIEKLKLEIRN